MEDNKFLKKNDLENITEVCEDFNNLILDVHDYNRNNIVARDLDSNKRQSLFNDFVNEHKLELEKLGLGIVQIKDSVNEDIAISVSDTGKYNNFLAKIPLKQGEIPEDSLVAVAERIRQEIKTDPISEDEQNHAIELFTGLEKIINNYERLGDISSELKNAASPLREYLKASRGNYLKDLKNLSSKRILDFYYHPPHYTKDFIRFTQGPEEKEANFRPFLMQELDEEIYLMKDVDTEEEFINLLEKKWQEYLKILDNLKNNPKAKELFDLTLSQYSKNLEYDIEYCEDNFDKKEAATVINFLKIYQKEVEMRSNPTSETQKVEKE